jgi:hypothetical protein
MFPHGIAKICARSREPTLARWQQRRPWTSLYFRSHYYAGPDPEAFQHQKIAVGCDAQSTGSWERRPGASYAKERPSCEQHW